MITRYCISWSTNGATYFRQFDSKEERDELLKRITGRNIRIDTWENQIEKEKRK